MKRKWWILLIGMIVFGGCVHAEEKKFSISDEPELLQKIYEKNHLEVLLKTHQNVALNSIFMDSDGNVLESSYSFADKDTYVYEDSTSYVLFYQDGEGYGFDPDENLPYRLLFLDDMYNANFQIYRTDFLCGLEDQEKLLSVQEIDGILVVESILDSEYAKSFFGEDDVIQNMTEIESCITEYKVDMDNYELKEINTYIELEDGRRMKVIHAKINYDLESYTPTDELRGLIYSKDSRTLTLITDPGTEKEKVYTQSICKGGMIEVVAPENYSGIYIDEACTELFYEVDRNSDLTVYMAEGK